MLTLQALAENGYDQRIPDQIPDSDRQKDKLITKLYKLFCQRQQPPARASDGSGRMDL
jgi:hypothetical protein